jgi:hypothetical protein
VTEQGRRGGGEEERREGRRERRGSRTGAQSNRTNAHGADAFQRVNEAA